MKTCDCVNGLTHNGRYRCWDCIPSEPRDGEEE